LTASGVTAPTIGVDLLIFVGKRRFKGAAMQVQFDHVTGGKRLLRQVGEEEFVNNACTRDANGALLLGGGMGGHHHAAEDAERSDRHVWAIVEGALDLALRTLLK